MIWISDNTTTHGCSTSLMVAPEYLSRNWDQVCVCFWIRRPRKMPRTRLEANIQLSFLHSHPEDWTIIALRVDRFTIPGPAAPKLPNLWVFGLSCKGVSADTKN